MRSALVLGGGGVTGISWTIGVLYGLAATGRDVTDVDTVIGTSAGSVVGVHVAAGTDLGDLRADQDAPAASEIASPVDLDALFAEMTARAGDATDPVEVRRRIGAWAREVDGGAEGTGGLADARRAAIAARLPVDTWPTRTLRVTAVDADSGEVVVLGRTDGVALADAVTASCAVPGVWPTVPVRGREYMDGGTASLAHVGLAAGHDRVVVVSPMPTTAAGPVRGVDDEVAELRAAGVDVTVVGPDPEYLAGPGAAALDPSGRGEAAALGERFGRRAARG